MKKNERKSVKMKTMLVIGYVIMDALLFANLYFSYSTVNHVHKYGLTERYYRSYIIFIIASGVFCLLLSTINTTYLGRHMRLSLKAVNDASAELARGNADIEVKKIRNDEFGQVLDEYQMVIDNIHEQARIAEAVANGNLLVNVIPKSEQDILGNALKILVERNLHALSNVNESAYQVMTSASQVATASENLAQGSTEQASAIEQITASISDIAEKTKDNAGQANEASDLISEAISSVRQGNEQMHDMIAAMDDINKSSESIQKIIKVIDDIAFQTNILALNAAVEAARAGEAGKGFAVVAEEVRNLAAKSASAAAETAELIEDSIVKVGAGTKIAADTARALEEITTGVSKSDEIIKGIAEASNYQATAVAQINQAIGQVSQVVQTNSATSEECAAASEELSNQAIRMRELLSVFQLGETSETYENKAPEYMHETTGFQENPNEQIISLGEGFGKY